MPRDPLALARFALVGTPSVQRTARRFTHRRGTGTAGRRGGALHGAADGAADLGLRPPPHGARPRRRLAGRAREAARPSRRGWRASCAVSAVWCTPAARSTSLAELPPARAVLLDTSPRSFVALAGPRLSRRAGRPWARFRPGPGTCKVDWALDGPVPWAAEACRRTVTVHVGGTFDEVARAEAAVRAGRHAEQPFVLVAQPCVVDPTRAPAGQAHAVGLLPRAQRLVGGHERAHGGADRALRPRLPRPGAGPVGAHGRRGGVAQPEPAGR